MLRGLAGLVMLPQEPGLQVNPWKEGAFFNFKVISQEASDGDVAKTHHYNVSMFVNDKDIKKWRERLTPGKMFLLSNGNMSATIPEGQLYPIYQIKVSPANFNYLKRTVTEEV